MNILSNILEGWTNYELIMIISMVGLMTIVGIVSVHLFIRDKRSVLFSLVSAVTTNILIVLILSLVSLLNLGLSEGYSFVFLLTATLSVMNVTTLNSYLIKNRNKKDFDIDFVTRDHFTDSLKLTFFICLFFSILIAFTSGEIRNVLIASGVSSVLSISTNHLLARIFFKDKKSEK